MRLYIIRHGETEWNTQMRLQGQTDIPLNENGRALAEKAAEGMKEISFDLAVTSPLGRAAETAQIVLGERHVPVYCDRRIQEITFGEMEGIPFRRDADEASNPQFYCFFHATDRYVPMKGGETFEALYQRTGDFLTELKDRKEWYGKNILISTHGAASRALLANVNHTQIRDFWGPGVPKNCAVSIVELADRNGCMVADRTDAYSDTGLQGRMDAGSCEKKENNDLVWTVKELDKLYYENI